MFVCCTSNGYAKFYAIVRVFAMLACGFHNTICSWIQLCFRNRVPGGKKWLCKQTNSQRLDILNKYTIEHICFARTQIHWYMNICENDPQFIPELRPMRIYTLVIAVFVVVVALLSTSRYITIYYYTANGSRICICVLGFTSRSHIQ